MYKVLIVDDEPLIREGLTTLIEWQDYGFEVIYAAKDGFDALERYELYKPDLLIVDIRMPGMDGLKLIETVRSKQWNPKLLILSGYADFEYAKKAIRSKVEGYILKPVDEDELIDYLSRIKKALDREKEVEEQVGAISGRHKEALIQSVLTDGHAFTDSISSRASDLDLVWKQYQVLLLLLQFDNEQQVDVLFNARQQLERWVEEEQLGVVFTRDLHLGILLRETYVTPAQQDKLYNRLLEVWKEGEYPLFAAIGHTVYRFVDIKASYDQASALMKRRFFAERSRMMSLQTAAELKRMIEQEEQQEAFDIAHYADKLYYAMDVAGNDSIRAVLQQVKKDMMRHDLSEQAVKTFFMQMLTSAVNRWLSGREGLKGKQEEAAWVVQLYKHSSINEMLAMVEKRIFALVESDAGAGNETLVKRMIDLIHRNYHENLKLETLAEVFHYNSAYLGKLFKNHTGEYFNTYLDKVRIDNAKSLLEEGLKVYQVAERVGYTNVDYFHSKFKKYTGIAPSAYRKHGS